MDADADAVTLMTLHNAKGLEYPVVFITGLEDGLFPLAKAFDDPPLLEEERRLFYVGITRAERKLFLTHAEERRRNGELMASRQSSFLDAIPGRDAREARHDQSAQLGSLDDARGRRLLGVRARIRSRVAHCGGDIDEFAPRPSPATRRPGMPVQGYAPSIPAEDESQDAPVFARGVRVKHRKFGSGTIAEVAGSGRDAKVKVDFDDTSIGRKTLVIAQANLERGDD